MTAENGWLRERGVPADDRLCLGGSASFVRVSLCCSADPLKNAFVTEHVTGDGALSVVGWTIGP